LQSLRRADVARNSGGAADRWDELGSDDEFRLLVQERCNAFTIVD
jgi:hypothetical protein